MENSPGCLRELILVRLSATTSNNFATLSRSLARYFENRLGLSNEQWQSQLTEALAELERREWIESHAGPLTNRGKAAAAEFLRIPMLPAGCKWLTLRNRQLIALALEIRPQSAAEWKRLASADGLRAAVIVKFHQLAMATLPSLTEAMNALAQKIEPDAMETRSAKSKRQIREAILRKSLLADEPGELKTHLPALATKASDQSVESLRQAVICRWLDHFEAKDVNNTESSSSDAAELQNFAQQLHQLARDANGGHYGENKVFLSYLWEEFRHFSHSEEMTRGRFNALLLEANRQSLIALSRADLTSAMDPRVVAESEIALPHAVFHFLRTDLPNPSPDASATA